MSRAEAVAELKRTYAILDADIKQIECLFNENSDAALLRTLIRAYSALFEGLLYQLRQVALESAYGKPEMNIFSEEEIAFLKKGRGVAFRDRMLQTFELYPRIHGTTFEPDKSHDGWEAMTRFIKIRNGLMHPKSSRDLDVSNKSYNDLFDRAKKWFYITTITMLQECAKADERYRRDIDQGFAS